MSASADVLAMAKVEVDIAAIPEGKNVRITPIYTSLSWSREVNVGTGHHQVAWKANLHPPPYRIRDPGG